MRMNIKVCWKMNSKIMKALLTILFTSWMCVSLHAQDADDPQPQDASVRDKIKAARIGLITQRLNLTPEQAQKFWPLYNEFDQKRAELRKLFRDAQREINPNNPDPKQQQALVDLGLKIKQDELNLEKDYSHKLIEEKIRHQFLNFRKRSATFATTSSIILTIARLSSNRKKNFAVRNLGLKENEKKTFPSC